MKYIKTLIVLSFVFVLLYLGFKDISLSEILTALKDVNIWVPIAFIFGTFLQFFIRAYRWGILLRPYKSHIPVITLYNFTVIGYMLNLLPGRVGELAKAFMLAKEEKIDKGVGLASVFLERLIDFLMIVVFFLISLLLIDSTNSKFLKGLKANSFIFLIIVFIVFLMLFLLNNKKFFSFVEKVITFFSKIIPLKHRKTATVFLIDFARGIRFQLGVKDTVKLIFVSIMVWTFLIPFYWFLLREFGIILSFSQTTAHFSILVASAAIPTPGMAGTLEISSIKSLTEILGNSIRVKAAAYTIVLHFIILLSQIVTGMIAFKMQGLNFGVLKKLRKEE
jgi:uncharacterized protein (TIRG00374 family)